MADSLITQVKRTDDKAMPPRKPSSPPPGSLAASRQAQMNQGGGSRAGGGASSSSSSATPPPLPPTTNKRATNGGSGSGGASGAASGGGGGGGSGGGGFFASCFACCMGPPATGGEESTADSKPPPADVVVSFTKPAAKPSPNSDALLGEFAPHHVGRFTLVLDLDETLVHSSFKPVPGADFVVPVEIEDQVHHVYVAKRPGVDEFMKRMGELFEVVVFTASLSKYADPVLDLLDRHRVVQHRLFREHCSFHKGQYIKDLSRLGRDIRYTIIIDNCPASYLWHPENAVPIGTWFDDLDDTELIDLIPFLEDMTKVSDVRTVMASARDVLQ